MSKVHLEFEAHIQNSAEAIFRLIADLPNYGRWLSGSDAFGDTTQVEPYPVRLGTTYLDAGPAGDRPGRVTEFDPPRRIAFHQTMSIRRGPLRAEVDILIGYMLETVERTTRVVRTLDLDIRIPGLLKLMQPFVVAAFRKENARVLRELKRHLEAR
jgi:uncharacterized protein YndB with AHSA1/START domain